MFYFLYGTDNLKSRQKLHDLLDLAKKKRPDAEVFKITTENWSEGQLDELLVSQGLFSQKYTVVLDNLFEKKDMKEFVLDRLEKLKESEQIFLILENKVDAASLKKIEKHSEKTQEFNLPETNKKDGANIFSVADGLLLKDKKGLWISYLKMLKENFAPEELHGIFFWQVKNMIIASRAISAKDSGLSPFVYSKALSGARNYKTEELLKMSDDLVQMTTRVRSGLGDLDIMMEKWILSL